MINQAHIFVLQVDLLDFSWRVGPDLCGSNRFPIILVNDGPPSLEFQHLCSTRLNLSATNDSDDPMFTFILKDFADKTIPKTLPVPKRFNKPWFSDICKDATKERNRALERFKRKPVEGSLKAYRAKARRDIRHSEKTSWRNYVTNMNS